MQSTWSFVTAHSTIIGMGSLWLFSNVVTALPSPTNEGPEPSGTFYKFFFAFAHGLSGSLPRVFPQARVFNDPTRGSQTYFANSTQPTPPANGGD